MFEALFPSEDHVPLYMRARPRGAVYHYQQVPNDEKIELQTRGRCATSIVSNSDILFGENGYHRGMREKSHWAICCTVLCGVISKHWGGLCGIVISYISVLCVNATHFEYIDASFFKGMGLLLAVLMSLRAKNAVSRRMKLVSTILKMLNAARNILEMTDLGDIRVRRDLYHILSFTFAEIAIWFGHTAARVRNAQGKNEVEAAIAWHRMVFSKIPAHLRLSLLTNGNMHALGVSPRPILTHLRDICDSMFNVETFEQKESAKGIDKISSIRRYHRNIDKEMEHLIDQFDHCCGYEEQVTTPQFSLMLSMLIFLYVAFYPWQAQHESKLVLGLTTSSLALVFYGLNSITQEMECPLEMNGQGFNVMLTFQKAFINMETEMEMRERCRAFLIADTSGGSGGPPPGDTSLGGDADELLSRRQAFVETELRRQSEQHVVAA